MIALLRYDRFKPVLGDGMERTVAIVYTAGYADVFYPAFVV